MSQPTVRRRRPSMLVPSGHFVGSTDQCFDDFMATYPQIEAMKIVAEFCGVSPEAVLRWRLGGYMPEGELLLKLRCFLSLAGYHVTEVQSLDGAVRQLGFIVGLGLMTPMAAQKGLGYSYSKGSGSLWRLLLVGGGFQESVRTKLSGLVTKHGRQLRKKMETKQLQLSEFTSLRASRPAAAESSPSEQRSSDPALATAFGRAIAMTTALAHVVQRHGLREEVIDATRGGQDLIELTGILQQLSSGPDQAEMSDG